MHELSLVANLFEILEAQAKEAGLKKIISIKLRLGTFSGVVPECLETAFEVYKEETIASEARLIMEIVPVKFKCRRCQQEATKEDFPFICPYCDSSDLTILDGTDLTLLSLEAEV